MPRAIYDDEEELEKKDSEITLGMASLLGIFFGLVLVCGVFFGFGYSLGRGGSHSQTAPAAAPASNAAPATTPAAALPKPSALQSPDAAQQSADQTPQTPDQAQPPASSASPAPESPAPEATAAEPESAPAVEETRPAKPEPRREREAVVTERRPAPVASIARAAQPAVNPPPYPVGSVATPAAGGEIMVQVAAVSRPEDAAVLVSALEKRGYHAVMRSSSQDKLMHVQIGPFPTRDAARQMRTRLQADGYNAILKF